MRREKVVWRKVAPLLGVACLVALALASALACTIRESAPDSSGTNIPPSQDSDSTGSSWTPPVAMAPAKSPAQREPCAEHEPLRQVFFGDLHVHTSASMDANARDMLGDADSAFRFAKGHAVGLSPYDVDGNGSQLAQLNRPLDFAAITDHAENIGEVRLCRDPDSPSYQSASCRKFRGDDQEGGKSLAFMASIGRMNALSGLNGPRRPDVCGPDHRWCRDALSEAWNENWETVERHYDRTSECRFTSFHGYEYSNSPAGSMLHRNLIFRNEIVPEIPLSAIDEPDPIRMLERMSALCNDTDGSCDAISIPHNPNASSGRMFGIFYRDEPLAEQRRQAKLRERMEPLLEMMQVKGESECRSGMWNVFGEDELCDFEKARGLREDAPPDCEDGYGSGASAGMGCQSRLDFARYAITEGMAERDRIGVNPYRVGLIGATDAHNANPGDTEEDSYSGCCGSADDSPAERLLPGPNFGGKPIAARNPGGLMGVWAEENSRDALFDSMKRREVFATSGTRITPRFFAGWDLPENACEVDLAGVGYTGGVPMGGELESRDEAPLLVASALADPAGGALQRLQIVKVWHEGGERFHQQVVDLSGEPSNGASVDLSSCEPLGAGATELCGTWRDPSYDPRQSAAYYVRVIENPSCRHHWRDCLKFPESERPAICDDSRLPKVVQERAWTSPIWMVPTS